MRKGWWGTKEGKKERCTTGREGGLLTAQGWEEHKQHSHPSPSYTYCIYIYKAITLYSDGAFNMPVIIAGNDLQVSIFFIRSSWRVANVCCLFVSRDDLRLKELYSELAGMCRICS